MPPISTKPKSTVKEPLWKGPEVDGITYSMLCGFLSCRERFRIKVIEGLKVNMGFNHYIEYGHMWHLCEEVLAEFPNDKSNPPKWQVKLKEYCTNLAKKHPHDQEKINQWYQCCKIQFPLYVDYWKKHPDVKERTPLYQEYSFNVPYVLPSGRTVRLRGKFDSVDIIGKGKTAGIYLQENKTKSDVYAPQLLRQLTFDMQTMIYLTALGEMQNEEGQGGDPLDALCQYDIKGVRYNVVRRPMSGGKGSIKKHKAKQTKNKFTPEETDEQFYGRLAKILKENVEEQFHRFKVEVTHGDIEKFKRECLNPILENLCAWYKLVTQHDPFKPPIGQIPLHWRHPFGVKNSLDEGYASDLDNYLATGSTVGLQKVERLFGELT